MPHPRPLANWPRGRPLRLAGVVVLPGQDDHPRPDRPGIRPRSTLRLGRPVGFGQEHVASTPQPHGRPRRGGRCHRPRRPPIAARPRSVSGVGLVFQSPRPLPGTVAENLAYPFVVRGRPAPDPVGWPRRLDEVGLEPAMARARRLGAFWRRATEARDGGGAGADPEILALDEPTSALDPASARRIADLLTERPRRAA